LQVRSPLQPCCFNRLQILLRHEIITNRSLSLDYLPFPFLSSDVLTFTRKMMENDRRYRYISQLRSAVRKCHMKLDSLELRWLSQKSDCLWSRLQGFVSRLGEDFFSTTTPRPGLRPHQPLTQYANFPKHRYRSVSLTTLFYLAPSLRIRETSSSFPVSLSLVWCLVTEAVGFVLYSGWLGGKFMHYP
jgi:hypothetical protein